MNSHKRRLGHLAKTVSAASPNWTRIRAKLNYKGPSQISEGKMNLLLGKAAEAHVQVTLEEIAKDHQEILKVSPIRKKAIRPYKFIPQKDGQVLVFKNNNPYTDLDATAIFDESPLTIEVKLQRYKPSGKKGTLAAMKPQRISHLKHPVETYFNTNKVDYMLVISPDQLKPKSEIQQKFQEKNTLATTYAPKSTFRKHIKENLGIEEKAQ